MFRSRFRGNEPREARRESLKIRMRIIGTVLVLCLTALLGRIVYITETYGAEFERRAVRQLVLRHSAVETSIPPAPGGILDRNRHPLVDSERVFVVALDVSLLHRAVPTNNNPNPQESAIHTIHEALDIPLERLWRYMSTNADGNLIQESSWRVLAHDVPANIALPLAERERHVHLQEEVLRWFPDPFLAPQVLGFIRGDSASGLELRYQDELSGQPGRVFRSFQANTAALPEEIPPRDGNWLVTTLDSDLQRIAQRVVENAVRDFNPEYAGIALMQPHTGEILAMAQWPSFSLEAPDDGTLFTDRNIAANWETYNREQQMSHMFRTWNNFFISRTFEPGSTFKPFVIAAAIEENLIAIGRNYFFCEGVRTIDIWEIPCHNRFGHGNLSVLDALKVSCNLIMMDIIRLLGRDTFYMYRNDFGFGERTNIDLPGEEAVSAPGVMYTLGQLNPVELATSSIGQGFNATAIQSLNAFASLINGGYIMRPFVVSQIIDANGNVVSENTPTVVRNVLSQSTSDSIRRAMQSVISPEGTGRFAIIEDQPIGGKTGTAQQGIERDWIVTSFIGYMPVENPQFLAIAIVYNPEEQVTAGVTAAPMLRNLFQEIIRYRQILPDGTGQVTGILQTADAELMTDFSGMELREATRLLNSMSIDYEIAGRGSVISHHIPAAGQPVPGGIPVFLYLDGDLSDIYELTFMPDVTGLTEEQAFDLVVAADLVPIFVSSEATDRSEWNLDPITGRPQLHEETSQGIIVRDKTVYRQFPSAGQHIQRGSQVRLRMRF